MKFFTSSWINVEQAFIVSWEIPTVQSWASRDPCSTGQGVLCQYLMIQGAKGAHPGWSCCRSMPWCGAANHARLGQPRVLLLASLLSQGSAAP